MSECFYILVRLSILVKIFKSRSQIDEFHMTFPTLREVTMISTLRSETWKNRRELFKN